MNNVGIIGCGQLGSRHLQALARLKEGLRIFLVDPARESLLKAQDIYLQSGGHENSINMSTTIADIESDHMDVVVVATNSVVRKSSVEELLNTKKVKYLVLEKFLFPSLEDYREVAELLNKHRVKAWVNCPRRMFQFYKELRGSITQETVFDFNGSQWGLGCNGIHMIDLIAYLTGEINFHLDTSMLDREILESKRRGYIEFTGTIRGTTESGGHVFTLNSFNNEGVPFSVKIESQNEVIRIYESEKRMIRSDKSGGIIKEERIQPLFQSQLTDKVVDQLLKEGTCELTPYSESSTLHQQYLESLLKFMNDDLGMNSNQCLIT